MDVIVTWEDQTYNCVCISELQPMIKNETITLGTKVKMRFKSKWYYGTVTTIEDDETGEIKTVTPLERRQSNGSDCSEDNVPISMLNIRSENKKKAPEVEMEIQTNGNSNITKSDHKKGPETEIEIQTNDDSNITNCPSDESNITYCLSDQNNSGLFENMDIADVDDPDYQPEKDLSPTVLQDYQEITVDHPMLLSCEVPHCGNDIFNSCNTCFLFLCSEHFSEKVSCTMHGHIVENNGSIPHHDILSDQRKQVLQVHSARISPISVLDDIETHGNTDEFRSQTCEVPNCFSEVFSSCFRCNILLCWTHFDGDISCEIHKKKEQAKKTTDSIFNKINSTESSNIEDLYPIEGSRREFNLAKEEKIDKRKLAKMLRNTGQEYISPITKKTVPAKCVGAYCNVANCKDNNRYCYRFTEIDRKVIFADFYSIGETSLKRDFILRHITECEPKQRTLISGGRLSRRKRSLKYYLSVEGKKYPVCRTFFLNTLAVSEKFVRNSLAKPNQSGILFQDTRGGRVERLKQRDNKINNMIREHINRFPRVESHYCRANSTKEYLHSDLSVKKMHRMLLNELEIPFQEAPGLTTYKKMFKSMNLAFHRPKKDQCSLCAAYHDGLSETKSNLKEKYDKHTTEKQTVRQLKDTDKQEASSENHQLVCASFDLQQVMFLPITKEGAIFYKRQLSVYNFTIYNIANRDCYCFTWPETESRRGSSEIATAVSMFLHEHDVAGFKSISLYADGCAGQNKNSIVASALLYCINNVTHLQTITLRFFAPSHGQNEGDSAHSAISYAVQKAGDIFLPSQLYPIIQMARSSQPYILRPLQYSDFKDYKELSQNIKMLSLRKDNESGASINWTEVVEFKVDKETPTTLYFKTSHTDVVYRSITVRRSQVKFLKEPIRPLNDTQIKISKPKFDDLLSLCSGDCPIVRFHEYQNYYKNLPHE